MDRLSARLKVQTAGSTSSLEQMRLLADEKNVEYLYWILFHY